MKRIVLLALLTISSFTFGQWSQMGSDLEGTLATEFFGDITNISGDGLTILSGSTASDGTYTQGGKITVFSWDGTDWIQKGLAFEGTMSQDFLGSGASLSYDGNIIAFGKEGLNSRGFVNVYEWNGTSWVQRGAEIAGLNDADGFGHSVDISDDGSVLIASTPIYSDPVPNIGYVQAYMWNGTNYTPMGSSLSGFWGDEYFGMNVEVSDDGSTIAVGAYRGESNNAGYILIYNYNGTDWIQKGSKIIGDETNDYIGQAFSLSESGNRIAIGVKDSDANGVGSGTGQMLVYEWNGTNWTQLGSDIYGETSGDAYGFSISLSADGNIVAVGALFNDNSGTDAGSVRVYEWDGANWTQIGAEMNGDFAGDYCGSSVALSSNGNRVIVGYAGFDGAANFSGKARIFNTCSVGFDETPSLNGADISVSSNYVWYQWVDCNDNYSIINGATADVFTPTSNGSYACMINDGLCTDTTTCQVITTVGIEEENQFSFNVFPNPTNGILNISSSQEIESVEVKNTLGQIVLMERNSNSIDMSSFTNGIYFVTIETSAGFETQRISKK